MIALLQRVLRAEVTIERRLVAAIGPGILALIGVEGSDELQHGHRLLQRILSYRIFDDESGKMNRSVLDVAGGLLLVPQFTLVADTDKGNRPSFSRGAAPALGRQRFDELLEYARTQHGQIEAGVFGAAMQVLLVNDGPATFWLRAGADTGLKDSTKS